MLWSCPDHINITCILTY